MAPTIMFARMTAILNLSETRYVSFYRIYLFIFIYSFLVGTSKGEHFIGKLDPSLSTIKYSCALRMLLAFRYPFESTLAYPKFDCHLFCFHRFPVGKHINETTYVLVLLFLLEDMFDHVVMFLVVRLRSLDLCISLLFL